MDKHIVDLDDYIDVYIEHSESSNYIIYDSIMYSILLCLRRLHVSTIVPYKTMYGSSCLSHFTTLWLTSKIYSTVMTICCRSGSVNVQSMSAETTVKFRL